MTEELIDGRYKEFAVEVRRILKDNKVGSSREAARKTGINHATITTMMRGDRPSDGTIIRFACAYHADLTVLLRLAGYAETNYIIRSVIYNYIVEEIQNAVNAFQDTEPAIADILAQAAVFSLFENGRAIGESVMFPWPGAPADEQHWIPEFLTYYPRDLTRVPTPDFKSELWRAASSARIWPPYNRLADYKQLEDTCRPILEEIAAQPRKAIEYRPNAYFMSHYMGLSKCMELGYVADASDLGKNWYRLTEEGAKTLSLSQMGA